MSSVLRQKSTDEAFMELINYFIPVAKTTYSNQNIDKKGPLYNNITG